LNRARIAKQRVEIFKPGVDVRYSDAHIVSHDQSSIPCTTVDTAEQLRLLTAEVDVVGIDEAQFFDEAIVDVCNELANRGLRVIVAGLDMDSEGRPFGPMPFLMATAEYVTKVHAVCMHTGRLAHYSHRKEVGGPQVLLGESDRYEAVSRGVYNALRSHELG
jgi:thymidine kinase